MSMKSLSIVAAAALALCAGAAQAATQNGFANGGSRSLGVSTPAAKAGCGASSPATRCPGRRAHWTLFGSAECRQHSMLAVMLQNSIERWWSAAADPSGDTPTLSFWAKGSAGGTGNVSSRCATSTALAISWPISNNQFFQGSINPNVAGPRSPTTGVAMPVGATAAFIEFSQGGPSGPTIDPTNRSRLRPAGADRRCLPGRGRDPGTQHLRADAVGPGRCGRHCAPPSLCLNRLSGQHEKGHFGALFFVMAADLGDSRNKTVRTRCDARAFSAAA